MFSSKLKIMSQPSMNNLESIMNAANTLNGDNPVQTSPSQASPSQANSVAPESSNDDEYIPFLAKKQSENGGVPPVDPMVSMASSMGSIVNMVKDFSENPSKIQDLIKNTLTPDLMEQAKKMVNSGSGQIEQLMKEMQKKGVNPETLKSEVFKATRQLKSAKLRDGSAGHTCLLINQKRQCKTREYSPGAEKYLAVNALHCSAPVEISCSRLAIGPLAGKVVKAWFDATNKARNRRSSKLAVFAVGGELLIIVEDHDLTEHELTIVEQMLA
jgi:hypothetical protein